MEAILAILAGILVVTIISSIISKLRISRLKKELHREQIINNLYKAMISKEAGLVSIELLNSTPLDYLKQIKIIFIKYYFSRFSQLNQNDALMFGSYFWEIQNMLKSDRKEYLLNILYKAAEPIKLEIWADLLVQAIILENQLQDEGKLNDVAELIGFIIIISNQENSGEELISLFETKVSQLLKSISFNETFKNKIEIAMMRICVSLDVEDLNQKN